MRRKLKFSSNTDLKFRGEKDRKKQVLEFAHKHAVKIVVAAVVIAGVIATVSLIAAKDSGETVSKSGKTITYEKADTNYIGIVQPESFNALASNDADIYYVNQLVYSSLFTLDENLNIKPDLVKSYEADASTASVSVELRDAKFSDGKAVTSSDVEFTVEQIKAAGAASPYYTYASRIESIDTDGDSSLVVRFKSASDAALDNLVFPIVSKSGYTKSKAFVTGSGPYAYDSYEQGKEVRLKVNEHYYGEKAKNNLVLTILPAQNQVIGLMTMDAVTFAMSKNADAEEIAKDKGIKCKSVVSGEMEFLGFNHKNRILKDSRVRSAIAHAVDTEALIEENYGDSAVKTNSIYYPDFLGVKGGGISFDQKVSAKNLKKAGYKDVDKDGYLEDSSGKVLSVKLLIDSANKKRADAAELIRDDLESVGVKVEIEAVSSKDFKSRLEKGEFEMYLCGMKVDKQFNLTDLFGTYNYGKYAGKDVISKVAKLETALNAEEQKKAFEEAQKALNSEVPYFPICYKKYYMLGVGTYESDTDGTFFDCYRGVPTCEWKRTVAIEGEKDKEKKKQ